MCKHDQTLTEIRELTELVRKTKEKLEQRAKSFLVIDVAESDDLLFISSLETGSFVTKEDDHHYLNDDFLSTITKQYKEVEQC